jgi:hypothetical protein
MPAEKPYGSHDHTRRTDAALRPSAGKKRLLHRMQAGFRGKSLDGAKLCSLGLEYWNQAPVDQLSIQQHGAGTTFPFAASFFGARQPE